MPTHSSFPASNSPSGTPLEQHIQVIRGQRVLLDFQLAAFYGVETRTLLQSVKRNIERFPEDFMFPLTEAEAHLFVVAQPQTAPKGPATRGGHRHLPHAFTEQGVAMLSGLLRSPQAIRMNIEIMRAFVKLRHLLTENRDLAERLGQLEQDMRNQGQEASAKFDEIFKLLDELFAPPDAPRKPIGFHEELDANDRKYNIPGSLAEFNALDEEIAKDFNESEIFPGSGF